MNNLQSLVDGSAPLHKTAHVPTGDHFKARGYKEIAPNQAEDAPRVLLREFYEQADMFSLTDETLKQLRTVYKVDDKFDVQFAASFFVIDLEKYLVTYLDVIKTKEVAQRRGLGSQFVRDLVEFLEQQLIKNPRLKGGHFFVGQSQILKPHEFFKKRGFGPVPNQFKHIKQDGCDLAYRKIQKNKEEEKERKSGNSASAISSDIPDDKSDVSALTNQTSKTIRGKPLDKHCPLCNFSLVSGKNWARHCFTFHKDIQVGGIKCESNCSHCKDKMEASISGTIKSIHGGHKMSKCSKCCKDSEARRLTDGLCSTCLKVEVKMVVNVPTSNFLNARALTQLAQKLEIGPDDSLSMAGVKRQHYLLKEEYDYNQKIFDEDKMVSGQRQFKRPKFEEDISKLKSVPTLVVSHTDADALKKLMEIEKSALPDDILSMNLQSLCTMLPQEATVSLLKSRDYPKVASLIPLVLQRVGQLKTAQCAGIIFSCIIFGGLHWEKAQSMLKVIENPTQDEVIALLGAFIERTHGRDISQWFVENWNCVDPYHFKLIEYLKAQKSAQSYDLLHLSLCVVVSDTPLFMEYTTEFLKTPVSRLLFEYLKDRRHQQKLLFQEFTTLCSALMSERNAPILRTCKAELMKTSLPNWIEFIEKASSTIHLSDKGSIQEAINEFIHTYGPIDETFSKDLFSAGSSLGLLLHETPNKGNFKQLGLAHYVIGGSRKFQKQLWCVPSGDGKSRIMVFAALLGIKTGMFKMIHLVYANKHLMERDKADFEDLWYLAECQDRVEYHVGHDFQAEQDSLILVDESDRSTFDHPEAFEAFIQDKFCVCLTATPSNCDEQGIEAETIKSLGFKQFDYIFGQLPESLASRLQFDEVSYASTLEQKVAVVESLMKQGSVLVYAHFELTERLQVLFEGTITVDETTDPMMLRQLDRAPYKLLVASDSFAMRGIDYRSKTNPLFLVVAQQFPCTREALQGVARVGRFGDPCRKIKFADCLQLVNQRSQLEYNARLLKFVESRKAKVQVRAAETKKASPKKSQPAQVSRLPNSRTQKLLKLVHGQTSLAAFAGLQVPKKLE